LLQKLGEKNRKKFFFGTFLGFFETGNKKSKIGKTWKGASPKIVYQNPWEKIFLPSATTLWGPATPNAL